MSDFNGIDRSVSLGPRLSGRRSRTPTEKDWEDLIAKHMRSIQYGITPQHPNIIKLLPRTKPRFPFVNKHLFDLMNKHLGGR